VLWEKRETSSILKMKGRKEERRRRRRRRRREQIFEFFF
jgi:hypothetical protein